jgi:hypothetical protein
VIKADWENLSQNKVGLKIYGSRVNISTVWIRTNCLARYQGEKRRKGTQRRKGFNLSKKNEVSGKSDADIPPE